MISQKLQQEFNMLETAIFPEWQKADEMERKQICKKLGEFEGRKIIEEIDYELSKNTIIGRS